MTPTKDELIKAREAIIEWCKTDNPYLGMQNVSVAIKTLDAQIKACDVPKIEVLPIYYNPETHAIIEREWLNIIFLSLSQIEDLCGNALRLFSYKKLTGGSDGN
jgi:hypothetical protein